MKTFLNIAVLVMYALASIASLLFRWVADNWVRPVTAPIVRLTVAFVPAPVRTRLAQWRQHAHQPTGPPRDKTGLAFA